MSMDNNSNLLFTTHNDNTLQGSSHRVYSEEEHNVIIKFKDKYKAATSATERKNIARLEMFPALFNYWKGIGKIYDEENLRVKSNVCSLKISFRYF
jgi:hypothetical protein